MAARPLLVVFNKNLNASKPSEHPPSGEKIYVCLMMYYIISVFDVCLVSLHGD